MINKKLYNYFSKDISSTLSLKNEKNNQEKIIKWLDKMGVENYIINDDLTIDVKGNINLYNRGLDKFPDYIKFGRVGGYFSCYNNKLVSLEGCPVSVGGSFDCSDNHLVSLEGCPSSVSGYFSCRNNQLVSLEGCPGSVGGMFDCRNNKKQFSKEEVKKVCKVKHDIYV